MSPQAPGVTEFHSSVLVTDLSHSTSSQPTPVSRLFSPSTVPDSLVKGEQAPLHGGSPQGPASGPSECSPWSGSWAYTGTQQLPTGLQDMQPAGGRLGGHRVTGAALAQATGTLQRGQLVYLGSSLCLL